MKRVTKNIKTIIMNLLPPKQRRQRVLDMVRVETTEIILVERDRVKVVEEIVVVVAKEIAVAVAKEIVVVNQEAESSDILTKNGSVNRI